jgi:hypothetical protein
VKARSVVTAPPRALAADAGVTDMRLRFDGKQRWLTALWACATVLLVSTAARADEASGRWTGELEAHGNYYLEKSTRVVVPTGRVSLEAPNGVRVSASYLADVISSASIAQTGNPDSDSVHIEVRQGVGLATGKTFALGDNEIDLSATAIHSWESDYISWIGGVRAGYTFNQKNSGLSLGVLGVHDTVYKNQQGSRNFIGHLDGVTFNFGFSQILSPTLTFGAGYQLVVLSGFLGNPYRSTTAGAAPRMETPPDSRVRHNLEATVSWYLPGTMTTLQPFFRVYTDSWKINAMTPELRVYQQLSRDFGLRLRVRYYLQGKAYFAQPASSIGAYQRGYVGYETSDPKLTEFDSIQLGARISWSLAAFDRTFLHFARNGVIDLSFDHQWTTIASNSFGNKNLFIILGGRLPF